MVGLVIILVTISGTTEAQSPKQELEGAISGALRANLSRELGGLTANFSNG